MKKVFNRINPYFMFSSGLRNEEQKKNETAAASSFAVADKKVKVYTTADTANYRLSLTDSSFSFHSNACFVNQ